MGLWQDCWDLFPWFSFHVLSGSPPFSHGSRFLSCFCLFWCFLFFHSCFFFLFLAFSILFLLLFLLPFSFFSLLLFSYSPSASLFFFSFFIPVCIVSPFFFCDKYIIRVVGGFACGEKEKRGG